MSIAAVSSSTDLANLAVGLPSAAPAAAGGDAAAPAGTSRVADGDRDDRVELSTAAHAAAPTPAPASPAAAAPTPTVAPPALGVARHDVKA